MPSICFAFLDISHLFADKQVADKCYQITRLYTNRLFPKSPMFLASDYEEILAWADSTHSSYLLIQSPGTVLFTEQAVLSCIREVNEHETMLLGDIHTPQDSYAALSTWGAFLDLEQWRRAKKPQWGKPGGTCRVKIPYQTQPSPELLTSTGIIEERNIAGYGHLIISKSLEHYKQVRTFPQAFRKGTKVMEVIEYQEAIGKCLFEDPIYYQDELDMASYQVLSAMYDETLEGTVCRIVDEPSTIPMSVRSQAETRYESNKPSIGPNGQLNIRQVEQPLITTPVINILDSTGKSMSGTGKKIIIPDTRKYVRVPSIIAPGFHGSLSGINQGQELPNSPRLEPFASSTSSTLSTFGCRKLQVEISKLYSVPNGFRPLEILLEYGFTSDTEVIYFARNTTELAFRQVLWEDWDGENFPKFISDYADLYRFNVPRHDVLEAWQKALETFGGAKEFKDLWQAYKKLRHYFTLVGRAKRFELAVEDGPGVYVYWGNLFTTDTVHYHEPITDLARDFLWFHQDLLKQNPNMLMEGTDHWGRPSCNQLKQRV